MAEELDDRVRKLQEDLDLLEDQVEGLRRAILLNHVFSRVKAMSNEVLMDGVTKSLDAGDANITDILTGAIKLHDHVMADLNASLSHLADRMKEEVVPEDAYEEWLDQSRKELLSHFPEAKVDGWLRITPAWDIVMGLTPG